MTTERVLVIKLGALGDMVMALGAMTAIRRHHRSAKITLLTRPAYKGLIEGSDLVDEVLADPAPRPWQVRTALRLRRMLRSRSFSRVYDLQGSDRSRAYTVLMHPARRVKWSRPPAPAPARAHASAGPHSVSRLERQLHAAGLRNVRDTAPDWLTGPLDAFDLPDGIVLLVPGSSPHRPEKRWPSAAFGALASRLAQSGLSPVIVGSGAERALAREIMQYCPGALDLTGRTSFGQLGSLGRRAAAAIGNDTGPMHLLAAVGCPSLVLFSAASDPAASLPRGPSVDFLQLDRLEDLPPGAVLESPLVRTLVAPGDWPTPGR